MPALLNALRNPVLVIISWLWGSCCSQVFTCNNFVLEAVVLEAVVLEAVVLESVLLEIDSCGLLILVSAGIDFPCCW